MDTNIEIVNIGEIRSDLSGFSDLSKKAQILNKFMFDTVNVDFSKCTWFDANMCAPLGVVFMHAIDNINDIRPINIPLPIRAILEKNAFLDDYGFSRRHDTYGTTIPYHRFSANEERYFADYLNTYLRGKDIPAMSEALDRRFKDSILEIFTNSAMHAESNLGIFTCGQYYPKKHKLDFCVADAGIGIRRKIYKELGYKMNSDMAIKWAMQEGHTTRKENVPGGLGLKLLREFIDKNKGRIQIVSDRGYWELSPQGETLTRLEVSFPGTVINIEINTADSSSYCLRSERES